MMIKHNLIQLYYLIKKYIDNILFYSTIVILICIVIFPNRCTNTPIQEENAVQVKYDTIFKVIEIKDTIPIYKEKIITKEKIIYDTIIQIEKQYYPITIELPKEQLYYDSTFVANDDTINFKAFVSGFKPSLDYYSINVHKQEINATEIKYKRFNHGLQIGIGYGVLNKKADVFIGYGISYKF